MSRPSIEDREDRRIAVPGLFNLRDVGGYPTRDGRRTRWRTLLRSDCPQALTADAIEQLVREGVRTVLDLRRHDELEERPNSLASVPGVQYLHRPMYDVSIALDPAIRSAEEQFRYMVDRRGAGVGRALSTVAAAKPAILVHCTNGFHRAGLVVALCLALATVPDEVIAEDFALSVACFGDRIAAMRERMVSQGWPVDRAAWFLDARPETILATLDHVRTEYGSVAAFASAVGVTADEQEALRRLLLG